ncbi:MAG: hypothetical protein EOL90_10785 [Spartobacteria bacterium]|nr:hypothetical protein [Spartobacteria bacterium]
MSESNGPAMLAWLWGSLAFCVFCGFPGCLLQKRVRSLIWVEALALSMGANAFLVLVLKILGLYYRGIICGYLLVALILCGFEAIPHARNWRFRWPGRRIWPWLALIPVLSLVFYLAFFFPFVQWDAIASWNRWAVAFTREPGCVPGIRWFYPQFLSFSYSFIYMAAGDTGVVNLAHGLAFVYVVLLLGAVDELSRQVGLRTRVAMGLVCLSTPFAQYVSSGYADIPAAAFSAVAATGLLRAAAGQRLGRFVCRCAFSGWLAAVALLHKQLGAVPFFILPMAWMATSPGNERQRRFLGAAAFLGCGVLTLLPWTLRLGTWVSPKVVYLTHTIYGNTEWSARVQGAFCSLIRQFTVMKSPAVNAGLALIACGCVAWALRAVPRIRILIITALAETMVGVAAFSYDTRALMGAIPLFCVGVAAGAEDLVERVRKPSDRSWAIVGFMLTLTCAGIGALYLHQGAGRFRSCFQYNPVAKAFTVFSFDTFAEKIDVFLPDYDDLRAWEKVYPLNPPFQYWLADPRLCALAQSGNYKRLDGALGNLWTPRDQLPAWRKEEKWVSGDIMLIKTNDMYLREFVEVHVEKNWIRRLAQIGCFTGYEIREIHTCGFARPR